MSDDTPVTDDRDPAHVIEGAVAHALRLADTWVAWNGQPIAAEGRVYTPHKAVRRLADHLLDHLAELEARLAGQSPLPDHWHASAITTPADLAPFTREDLDEARSRLSRLAQIWSLRLRALDDSASTGSRETPGRYGRSPSTSATPSTPTPSATSFRHTRREHLPACPADHPTLVDPTTQ